MRGNIRIITRCPLMPSIRMDIRPLILLSLREHRAGRIQRLGSISGPGEGGLGVVWRSLWARAVGVVSRHIGKEVWRCGGVRLHRRHGRVVGVLEVAAGQDGGVERGGVALLEVLVGEVEGGEGAGVAGVLEPLRLQVGEVGVLGRHDGRLLQLLLPVAEVAVRAAAEVQTGLLLAVGGEAGVAEGVGGLLRAEAVVVVVCEGAIRASKGRVERRVVRRGGGVAAYMVGMPCRRRSPALHVRHCA